jgi:hypothetical protein
MNLNINYPFYLELQFANILNNIPLLYPTICCSTPACFHCAGRHPISTVFACKSARLCTNSNAKAKLFVLGAMPALSFSFRVTAHQLFLLFAHSRNGSPKAASISTFRGRRVQFSLFAAYKNLLPRHKFTLKRHFAAAF